jgi:hypothetical protein
MIVIYAFLVTVVVIFGFRKDQTTYVLKDILLSVKAMNYHKELFKDQNRQIHILQDHKLIL